MIRSNRYGWLPLATGNKSELAVGYCTLYGDMAGGFAVLCDVFKRDVYAVARYINETVERREVIPVNTLTKAPSAELAPINSTRTLCRRMTFWTQSWRG